MLSPTPRYLFCALLLCLPLAVFFTITSPTTTFTNYHQNPIVARNNHVSQAIRNLIPSPPPSQTQTQTLHPGDDGSLLRLASQVNPKPSSPKKVAFLFLTTTPLPLAPLWELYFNQAQRHLFNIYVHADPRYMYNPPFSGAFADRVFRSEPAQRFTPSLSSAARRLLAHALLDDKANSMFALISPSCIPLRSFNFTYRFLTKSQKSFVEILKNERGAYGRWAARGSTAMLPEVKFREFRIGSQFWVLTRKHAKLVVSDRRIYAKFNQTCLRRDACFPEENYFPTLIHMRDPRGSVSATLTHVNWNWSGRSSGHPRMYKASEVGPELIASLRNSRLRYGDDGSESNSSVREKSHPFLFARKFSPDCIQPLLRIANHTLLKD
ncbi:hypothetical protein K2173_009637 [Erythroxylum novogranatense]|uniref:Core-2/I-branching beta-1,6-N-acetylglucosaminyltransferase family protein n=1 Tax=Erythroxylum novogranatense TaxID=1862640 RepID=A0AAV8U4H7_9ROSI|nr:hypothetical protein K2173_009637 [Erythroxylum novogranatense]